MSVLHLLGSRGDGGAETYFVDLVSALQAAGIEETCAIRRHPGRADALAAAGVVARGFNFGGPLDILSKPAIAAFARRTGARAAVAWMNRAARHTPAGPWKRIGRLGGYYSLKYYKGFDHLVGNTRDIADWIVAQGWPATQVSYIPNFAAAAEDGAPVSRASLDTPEDAPLLLGMGRLHDAKAHDISLKALALVPEAYLWIAGDGALEGKLKAMAGALGVADRVRFLGWRNDAGALYRTADVCVFPSRFEPLGNVVIQAWAHGLPVVAADSQGPGALIRHGEDGILVPIDEAETLADGVKAILADPMLKIRLIQNGHARVENEFSQGAVVEEWRSLFSRLGAL
jgi:glycosyltransferase involved in cell wall biosynthesis